MKLTATKTEHPGVFVVRHENGELFAETFSMEDAQLIAELPELVQWLNNAIVDCAEMTNAFRKNKMETAEILSEGMRRAYIKVLNKISGK